MRKYILSLYVFVASSLLWMGAFPVAGYGQSAGDIVVVVNKANDSTVTKNDVKKMLLGETTTWPNKAKVGIALPPPGNAVRVEVLQRICGMNESLYTRRQLQAAFTGGATAAIHELSPAAVKEFVKANPGAIGFIRKSEVDDSVKVAMPVE